MTSLRKIAAVVTCVALIGGTAILWLVYKENATERNLAEAVRIIRVRAEQGDTKAQYRLGLSYHDGQGVPQDYAESVRWLRKAADQGDAKPQYGLGSLPAAFASIVYLAEWLYSVDSMLSISECYGVGTN